MAKGAQPAESVTINGVTYLSSASAAKKFGYTKDYIGQLARAGKIESVLIGRNWFVDESSLTDHKGAVKYTLTKQKKKVSKEENTSKTIAISDSADAQKAAVNTPNRAVVSNNVAATEDTNDGAIWSDLTNSPASQQTAPEVGKPDDVRVAGVSAVDANDAASTDDDPDAGTEPEELFVPIASKRQPTRQAVQHEYVYDQGQSLHYDSEQQVAASSGSVRSQSAPTMQRVSAPTLVAGASTAPKIRRSRRVVQQGASTQGVPRSLDGVRTTDFQSVASTTVQTRRPQTASRTEQNATAVMRGQEQHPKRAGSSILPTILIALLLLVLALIVLWSIAPELLPMPL